MSTETVEIVALVGGSALAAGLLFRRRHDSRWQRAMPGLIATVAVTVGFVASYLWLFERDDCSDRGDVACMMNANDGSLTFLAVLFAGVGLWAAAISRWADQRRERDAHLARVRNVLSAAVDECIHNLIHVGGFYDEEGKWYEGIPQLTAETIPLVLDPSYRPTL